MSARFFFERSASIHYSALESNALLCIFLMGSQLQKPWELLSYLLQDASVFGAVFNSYTGFKLTLKERFGRQTDLAYECGASSKKSILIRGGEHPGDDHHHVHSRNSPCRKLFPRRW